MKAEERGRGRGTQKQVTEFIREEEDTYKDNESRAGGGCVCERERERTKVRMEERWRRRVC